METMRVTVETRNGHTLVCAGNEHRGFGFLNPTPRQMLVMEALADAYWEARLREKGGEK